jgi:hypothetical protein
LNAQIHKGQEPGIAQSTNCNKTGFLQHLKSEATLMDRSVTITKTGSGATTAIASDGYEWSKEYSSWGETLDEAVELELINKVEYATAKVLLPGFPFAVVLISELWISPLKAFKGLKSRSTMAGNLGYTHN